MKNLTKKMLCAALAALTSAAFCSAVQAVPILQLYLEGATYNDTTESWELTPEGSSNGEPFRLWTIGNIAGPGGKGSIHNVRLSVAYAATGVAPVVALTPSTTGGFGGFTDPSIPTGTGNLIQTVTDGSRPILGSGKPLPAHGIYGPGTDWQEFALGDFTQTDSPIADFISTFPSAPAVNTGQINVYEVSVTGGSGMTLHFDLYDSIAGATHAKFAPFSHDADGDANIVPAPGAALLAMIGFALVRRSRRMLV